MGPVFSILFWLILCAIYAGIFLFFAGLTILGWFKKWRWLSWLAGIPATLMVVLAVVVAGLYCFVIIDSMNPRSVYANTFGVKPAADVTDIQSDLYWFADTGSTYLKFRTTEDRFRSLLASDLSPITPEELGNYGLAGSSTPDWWDLKNDAEGWLYYFREHNHADDVADSMFAAEWELMAYDPGTGFVYYHFIGID